MNFSQIYSKCFQFVLVLSVLFVLLSVSLWANPETFVYEYKGSFIEFVKTFSRDHKLNVVLSPEVDVKQEIVVSLPFIKKEDPEEIFIATCKASGLAVNKQGSLIKVCDRSVGKPGIEGIYQYRFKNKYLFSDEKEIFQKQNIFPGKFSFIDNTLIGMDVSDSYYEDIDLFCKNLDREPERVIFRGIVLRTSLTNLKDYLIGFLGNLKANNKIKIGSSIESVSENFIDLVFTNEFPFELFLKDLKGYSEISRMTDFTLILDEGRKIVMNDGSKRAYKKSEKVSEEGGSRTQEYDYKQDGIKVNLACECVLKQYVYFNFDMKISKVVGVEGEQLPLTNEQNIDFSGRIKNGSIFYNVGLYDSSLESQKRKNFSFKTGDKYSENKSNLITILKCNIVNS